MLARTTYNVGSIICNVLVTRQLNGSAWGCGAKAGFFWAGVGALALTWSFWRLPEPKGRTYAELDALFERRTSARKFKGVAARDLIEEHERGNIVELKERESAGYVEHA